MGKRTKERPMFTNHNTPCLIILDRGYLFAYPPALRE